MKRKLPPLQKEGYTFVSIADICNYAKEARNFADNSICIVFFGGYIDNYTIAFPILKKYGIHADAYLANNLAGYINSDYEPGNYNRYTSYDVNQHINYNACLAFPDYLRDTAHKEHKIYPVTLYSYTEHKRCMAWRLNYIAKREGLDTSPFAEYESFANRICSLILSLGMKYNLTRNDSIIQEMQSYIAECNEKEFRTIEKLIDLLEKHSNQKT